MCFSFHSLAFLVILMGYQIGNRCFDTQQQADDVYFSQVVPLVVRAPPFYIAHLVNPVYHSDTQHWTLGGVTVSGTYTYPSCSPIDNFKDGMAFGGKFALLLVIAFAFRTIARLLMSMGG